MDGWDGDGWTGGNERMDENHEGVKEEPLLRRRADGRGGGCGSRVERGWPDPVSQRADMTRSNGGWPGHVTGALHGPRSRLDLGHGGPRDPSTTQIGLGSHPGLPPGQRD